METLGLSEDELCQILAVDPLTLISGQLQHGGELAILLDLLAEAREQVSAPALHRWARTAGPDGSPIELLLRRDFAAFEDALAELERRGFVIRGRARRPKSDGRRPPR